MEGWPSRSHHGEGNRLQRSSGELPDVLGVKRRACGDSLERNRRGPTRQPSSGGDETYKPKVKWKRAGRESEGLIVLWTPVTRTPVEGRGPALVALACEGKGEGMVVRPNYLRDRAREPQGKLFAFAKRLPGWRFRAFPLWICRGDVPVRCVASLFLREFVHAT